MSHDHCSHPTDAPTDARLQAAAAEGCEESRLLLSRRAMLGVTASLFSWAYMPKFAEAATSNARLLVVVLRGGMDGLNVVVPHGDRYYSSLRGGIAVPQSATIRLNSFFGLHPALKNFGAYYKAGDAAVVHATCVPLRNRSHFDAQDNLENGLPNNNSANPTGWLNRLLTALPAGSPIKSHGAITIGEAPLILRGPAPVLSWSPTWFSEVQGETLSAVRTLYRLEDREMFDMLDRGQKAHRLASRTGGNDEGISDLRRAFRGAARLIGASDGPRIAVLSVGGWDTHADQGATQGQMAGVLGGLDDALADFKTILGSLWNTAAVVMATEFGRTARVNGNSGTDHGVGTVALLAGGAVKGGKVFGDWPGLAPNQLYEQSDLRATTDIRSVFKGVLRDHIGASSSLLNSSIFPDSASAPILNGLIGSASSSSSNEAEMVAGTAGAASAVSAPQRMEPAIAKYRRRQRSA